jgi:glycosyltransferase involved in cell wall biosynthesis
MGGAQGNTLHTVRQLDKTAFDAQLWAGPGAYWDSAAESDLGKQGRLRFFKNLVRPINPLADVRAFFDLRKALDDEKPAILHTHSSKAGILGRLAARHVPIVIHTFHGFGFNDHQNPLVFWMYVWLERWAATRSTALVFVSKSNMETARQLKIGDPSRYHLIRSGIPIEAIRQKATAANRDAVRRELGIPSNAPLVTTIGPFKPQKNLTDFIRAARLIHEEIPNAHFLLVGDGSLRPDLEHLIRQLGLDDVFHLPGWRQDIADVLAATTVFGLTSLWEGLPRSMLEAMVAGVPAICYDTDGVRDLLGQGGGVLIPQGKVETFAREMVALLQDPTKREKFARAAKDLIGRDFDIDDMVRRQETLYGDLLRSTPVLH